MINDLREPGFSSHSWRLALETMKTQGETQGKLSFGVLDETPHLLVP